jgi:hypothetical protein
VSAIGNSTFWKIVLFVNGSVSQTRLNYEPKNIEKKLMGHKITGINFANHYIENLFSKMENLMINWLMYFKLKYIISSLFFTRYQCGSTTFLMKLSKPLFGKEKFKERAPSPIQPLANDFRLFCNSYLL